MVPGSLFGFSPIYKAHVCILLSNIRLQKSVGFYLSILSKFLMIALEEGQILLSWI